MRWPSISVIIPSIDRDERLQATAKDLDNQVYPNWECLVILQGEGSSALPVALKARLGARIRVFHADEANASLARNIGLAEATGDVVLFLDDDVEISDPEFLMMHARHFLDEKLAGVAGQILAPGAVSRTTRNWLSYLPDSGWLFFPLTYNRPIKIQSGGSGNLSVRRTFAISVGGMDAQYEKGAHREESDFCLRLVQAFGMLNYDPAASLVHFGEPSGGCRSWGHNTGVHPEHHVSGEWYFIINGLRLRTIKWRSLPFHLYVLGRRQILNGPNLKSLSTLARACARCAAGYMEALRTLSEGPRHLPKLDHSVYQELLDV